MTQLSEEHSQAVTGIPDDLSYRIIEEMGLGLTFRSCTCGQLPCARLRPLRDALETVRRNTATAMRDKCVAKVKEVATNTGIPRFGKLTVNANEVVAALSSLTLESGEAGRDEKRSTGANLGQQSD